MRTASTFAAAAALAVALCACSTEQTTPTPPAAATFTAAETPAPAATPVAEPVSGTLSETLVTGTATVEKLDLETRHLTLRNADGKSFSMKVPPEVRNLPQVKVGDEVVVSYYESFAYEVKKPGEATPGVSGVGAAGRAKEGQMPAAAVGGAVTVTVTIEAIDRTNPSVTLRGPDGDLVRVKVRNPSKLEHVQVGDLVEITYTEAMAASVQPKR
jgi:hypothetical protein